jgi:hypothetical protein
LIHKKVRSSDAGRTQTKKLSVSPCC